MFSVWSLVVASSILAFANVVQGKPGHIQVPELDMQRNGEQECSGYDRLIVYMLTDCRRKIFRLLQKVYLNPGQEVVLQSTGFETGKFVEGCMVGYY